MSPGVSGAELPSRR